MDGMVNSLAIKLGNIVKEMQDGLVPEVLANWYLIIQSRARELSPGDLADKIVVEQDPILPMKFKLNISKRTVPFVVSAIEQTLPEMPYSTRLYFEKVQEIILKEFTQAKLSVR
jgi:hypothetical protein